MAEAVKIRWAYAIGVFYILINAVFVYFEVYEFTLLPLAVLVIWSVFLKMDYLLLFVVFCVPLSVNLEQLSIGGVGMYLPTEPLLFGMLIIFIFKLLSNKSIDKKIFKHPVSIIIYVYLTWILVTSIFSELPIVSIKFLLAKMWFIAAFYFLAVHIFKNFSNIRRFQYLYIFPLIAVIIYTIVRHSTYGFEKDAGHWVMEPFYKDHTSYGAVLAMYVPVIFGLLIQKRISPLLRTILGFSFAIIAVGLILSFTRAAWVSVVAAVAIMGAILLKFKFRTLLISLIAVGSFAFYAQDDLVITMEKNKQDSSDNLAEHVESISNVSSDASNLERLNRWYCAIELFKERPLTGWGPGTFQFVYAPFQRSADLTIISTNNADRGNAHSEYLGPMAEQGFMGMLIMVILVLYICSFSFRLYNQLEDRELKILVITTFMGLFTYFVHGVLNNYLDTDKASAPFWGFIAILVAVDLYQKKRQVSKAVSST